MSRGRAPGVGRNANANGVYPAGWQPSAMSFPYTLGDQGPGFAWNPKVLNPDATQSFYQKPAGANDRFVATATWNPPKEGVNGLLSTNNSMHRAWFYA